MAKKRSAHAAPEDVAQPRKQQKADVKQPRQKKQRQAVQQEQPQQQEQPVAAAPPRQQDGAGPSSSFRNKEKVLIVGSRGITFRARHLMLDLLQLLPHSKKENKLDTKSDRGVITEIADMRGCTSAIYLEGRKHKDLYLWLAKSPSGPSVKFHVANVHTMEELKLSGNHLKGSRPALSFDANFDAQPHLQLLKEMLTQMFATPKRHNKSKPFFDHVVSFSVADDRIWLRNYQVLQDPDTKKKGPEGLALVEVGPRACLNPIKMFAGSFGGPVIYENTSYVSPNAIRAMLKKQRQGKYASKIASREERKQHLAAHPLPEDPLSNQNAFR